MQCRKNLVRKARTPVLFCRKVRVEYLYALYVLPYTNAKKLISIDCIKLLSFVCIAQIGGGVLSLKLWSVSALKPKVYV